MNRKQKPYGLQKRNKIEVNTQLISCKGIKLLALFLFYFYQSVGQIIINNPSFEGLPSQANAVPSPWNICLQSPDIQPGVFCVNLSAYHGNNYLGCACFDNASIGFEVFEQQLSVPLQFGKWYTFDIYLAKTNTTGLGCAQTHDMNVGFEIWGGYSSCSKTKLLAKTDTIDHLNWKKYTLKFQADGAYTHIILQSRFLGSNPAAFGYLLMDNMSPYLYEVNPQVWFTSSQSTALPDSCSVLYSMQTDSLINNVVLLESKLLDSTIQATKLSDSTAQATFNYAKQCGIIKDTLIVRALFNFGYFAYDTLIIDINCPDSSCAPPALPTITFTSPMPGSSQPCSYSTTGYTDSVYNSVILHSVILNSNYQITNTSNDTTWSFPLSYRVSCIPNLQDTLIAIGYFNNGYTTTDTLILNISCLKPQDSCSIDTTAPPPDTSQAELIIPNLITPNGDGKNDFFEIIQAQAQKVSLRIYNRWGDMVYENSDYQNNWNAASVTEGLYYYYIEAESKKYKGWAQVVR